MGTQCYRRFIATDPFCEPMLRPLRTKSRRGETIRRLPSATRPSQRAQIVTRVTRASPLPCRENRRLVSMDRGKVALERGEMGDSPGAIVVPIIVHIRRQQLTTHELVEVELQNCAVKVRHQNMRSRSIHGDIMPAHDSFDQTTLPSSSRAASRLIHGPAAPSNPVGCMQATSAACSRLDLPENRGVSRQKLG